MLQRPAAQGVALTQRAIGIDQALGHQEQADAFDTGRRIGQPRQHQVNDVFAEVLLTAADEDLAAADPVAAVVLWLRASAQQGQIGAGLRFGKAHGAGPFAADQLRQVALLELIAAVPVQRHHRAFGQSRVHPKRQRGAHQHLVKARRDHLRQALTTESLWPGHARPALFDEQVVGLDKAFRRGHLAILQLAALFVTVAIERCHHFTGKTCGLFEYPVDGVAVQAVAQLLAMLGHVEQLVQDKTHIAQRCLIVHTRPSTASTTACSTSNRLLTAVLLK
ncbi:hypothetical protein D3C77_407860 [compost metagenome]